MKSKFARCSAVLVFAGVLAADNPLQGTHWYIMEDGTRWRAGCVETERAAFLIEHMGFSYGGAPLNNVRCAAGTEGVSRQYGH